MRPLLVVFLLLQCTQSVAQSAVLKGEVYDKVTSTPLEFASVLVVGTQYSAITDSAGGFRFDLEPGVYSVQVAFVGYDPVLLSELRVVPAKPTSVRVEMLPEGDSVTTIKEVKVVASPFRKPEEAPLSMRTISADEIFRSPGGNRDISKVVQNLPGVASSVAFRNDIIVRGGSPGENRFFLDGIEVPNINHFATQGSSGGPVGMINVNFINRVDFYSSAFPVNRGNSLSSVMDIVQNEGNDERFSGSFMIGSSDVGITFDTPLGKKANLLFSMRRSYLQFLFQALKLPFLPTYNDFHLKQVTKLTDKDKLTIIGLGAIDDFKLNQKVNDGITDPEELERNEYILGNLPVNTQWNYTLGLKWEHKIKDGYLLTVLSRNMLNNKAEKYLDNNDFNQKLLDYNSQESENKARFEARLFKKGWKLRVGAGYQFVRYTNSTLNNLIVGDSVVPVDYNSKIYRNRFAVFASAGRSFFGKRLDLNVGLRTDMIDHNRIMMNPLNQISPRIAVSVALNEKWRWNSSAGWYHQLPAYTILGYRNGEGELVNDGNDISYIHSAHAVTGIEWALAKFSRVTVEGFYKYYTGYPWSIVDSVSLANQGGDFGVIGNEPVKSISLGRAYGLEVLFQQKLNKWFYGILSYTLVWSEFDSGDKVFRPSAWDSRHILNITGGARLKKNWEIGMKFRLQSGSPYTPWDVATSSLIPVWNVTQQGVLDYSRLNQERLSLFTGLDVRVDKKWYFRKWSLNVYLDVQNVYNAKVQNRPYLTVQRDGLGQPMVDPADPSRYLVKEITNESGTVLPSIGIMIEW